jgi:hypothetical protein
MRVREGIDERLAAWIAEQPLFFVATTPGAAGHPNVSPKGPIGTLAVLGERRVAYLDLVGSGIETVAHLRADGRIVLMLCAFSGPPRIVRLHGRGVVHEPGSPRFEELLPRFRVHERAEAYRTIVEVDVERVSESCGYGVPLMEYVGERRHALDWLERKLAASPDAIEAYKREKNAVSIDGLPGLRPQSG